MIQIDNFNANYEDTPKEKTKQNEKAVKVYQSDAQVKRTKHCKQGLYMYILLKLVSLVIRHYLCSENTVQGLSDSPFFRDNLKGLVSSGSECQ